LKLPILLHFGALLAASTMVLSHSLFAAGTSDSPRQRILFTDGWRFQKGDPKEGGEWSGDNQLQFSVASRAWLLLLPSKPVEEPAPIVAFVLKSTVQSLTLPKTVPRNAHL